MSSTNLYIGTLAITGILFCCTAIAILCLQWTDFSLEDSGSKQNESLVFEQFAGDAHSNICEQISVNVYLKDTQNGTDHYTSTKLDQGKTIRMLLSQLAVSY